MAKHIELGTGTLNWHAGERRSDRYGYVHLNDHIDGEPQPLKGIGTTPRHGQLVALVRATRPSRHIGDLIRGIYPLTPMIGVAIVLGIGTLHYAGDGLSVGLLPDDGRDHDWLNPHALYQAHEQTVTLLFVPDTTTL